MIVSIDCPFVSSGRPAASAHGREKQRSEKAAHGAKTALDIYGIIFIS
jgi:hypothetical protein